MKYYSEKTKKIYDAPEDLQEAEKALEEAQAAEKIKREQRATRAKEVEAAYENYQKLLKEFLKDYGSFHMTYNDAGQSLFDLFRLF